MFKSRGYTGSSTRLMEPGEGSNFIKGEVLGSLSRWDAEKLLGVARSESFPQGHVLFQEGAYGGVLYVVKAGSVELLRRDPATGLPRAIGYAREGDAICELALFTSQKLTCSARVPQFAELYVLQLVDLRRVLGEHPELSVRLCSALAMALSKARDALDEAARSGSSLGGSLKSFDLCSVVNNLIEEGESTGTLTVMNRRGVISGEICIRGSEIIFARTEDESGEDAALSLMIGRSGDVSFRFVPDRGDLRACTEHEVVHAPPTTLILDSLRMRDELARFEEETFSNPDARIQVVARHVTCPDISMQETFMAVVPRLQRGLAAGDLRTLTPVQRLKTYELLSRMLELGMVHLEGR